MRRVGWRESQETCLVFFIRVLNQLAFYTLLRPCVIKVVFAKGRVQPNVIKSSIERELGLKIEHG